MLTLLLLRHAKSRWGDPELDDYERPLAERGVKAARAMGAFMVRRKLRPDRVLCSGAVRARATLDLVLPEFGAPAPPVVYENALYLAAPDPMLDRLRKVAGADRCILLVGHNPGLHALALDLVGRGPRASKAALAAKLPTAGLAGITFAVDDWSQIGPAAGTLTLFMTPRLLA